MATRFYMPYGGTSPLPALALDSAWESLEYPSPSARSPAVRTKSNTALTTDVLTWQDITTHQWCWYQYVSETLQNAFAFTTSHTISMVVKCAEQTLSDDSHLAFSLRVVSGDGATVRGTLKLQHATSSEFPTSLATRIHSALAFGANVNALAGDRLVMEIGLHGVTPALEDISMRTGDPSATADFALTAGLTTDLCPWWEISCDPTFGTPVTGVPKHSEYYRRRRAA